MNSSEEKVGTGAIDPQTPIAPSSLDPATVTLVAALLRHILTWKFWAVGLFALLASGAVAMAQSCDQNLRRTIANQTVDGSVTLPTTGQNLDLGTQVVFYTAAASCGLSPGGMAAQYQVMGDGTLAFQTHLSNGQSISVSINDVLGNTFTIANQLTYSNDANTQTVGNQFFTVVLRKTQNLSSPQSPVQTITPTSGGAVVTGGFPINVATYVADGAFASPGLTNYTFEVLEQGPLVARFRMKYFFHSLQTGVSGAPANFCKTPGGQAIPNSPTIEWFDNPNGYVSEIVELRAGVNAVFFEEEDTYDWQYNWTVANVNFTREVYRGHSAADVAHGYTINVTNGLQQTYNACCFTQFDPYVDARLDLTASLDHTQTVDNPPIQSWPFVPRNQGRFSVAFDPNNVSTNWVAIMGGGAGKASGTSLSGVNFGGGAGSATQIWWNAFGIAGDLRCARVPDNLIRYDWALTTGTGQPSAAYVSRGPSYAGGPFNENNPPPAAGLSQNQNIYLPLTKLLTWTPDSTGETFSSPSQFLSPSEQTALFNRLKTDPAFVTSMCAKDSSTCTTFQYIANPTPSASQALFDATNNLYTDMLNGFWFRNGYFEDSYTYIRASEPIQRLMPNVPLVIADPNLTAAQKAQYYQEMLFFGSLLTDNDFVPVQNSDSASTFGTANMVVDYRTGSVLSILPLQANNHIKSRLNAVDIPGLLTSQLTPPVIATTGEAVSSPHYALADLSNPGNLCQESLQNGVFDCTTIPGLALNGQWFIDLETPPEPRFGGQRKKVTIGGDGPTEAASWYGQAGTIYETANPMLSGQLMQAWDDQGQQFSSFFTSDVFKINQNLPRYSYTLTDHYYPGYMSVMRSGFGTANESAMWMLHGDFYTDHRHNNSGGTFFYLLGAPISIDWSSYFLPIPSGSLMGNGAALLRETSASGPPAWDGTGPLQPSANTFVNPGTIKYSTISSTPSFSGNAPSTTASYAMGNTTWTRKTSLNRADLGTPVAVIQDSYSGGTDATGTKILSLNMMATGAVVTPSGNVTPTIPACDLSSLGSCANASGTSPNGGPYPSNMGSVGLSSGWNQFSFTGQWGIDFILMVYVPDATSNYQLGAWINNWENSYEAGQYQTAHGAAYTEMQYQFRLLASTNSKFVVVPYRHGSPAPVISPHGATSITVNCNLIGLN